MGQGLGLITTARGKGVELCSQKLHQRLLWDTGSSVKQVLLHPFLDKDTQLASFCSFFKARIDLAPYTNILHYLQKNVLSSSGAPLPYIQITPFHK